MPSHAQSSFNSRYPLHAQIEMKNPNLQGTLLQVQKKVWERVPTPLHPL